MAEQVIDEGMQGVVPDGVVGKGLRAGSVGLLGATMMGLFGDGACLFARGDDRTRRRCGRDQSCRLHAHRLHSDAVHGICLPRVEQCGAGLRDDIHVGHKGVWSARGLDGRLGSRSQ